MDKQLLVMGAGAGTGVLVPALMQKYVDPQLPGGIAGIKPSVLVPLATGGLAIGVGVFTDLISKKNPTVNGFIIMYGFAAVFSSIVNYATQTLQAGRGMQAQAGNQYMNVNNPYRVVSKVPSQQNIARQVGTGRSGVASGVIYS